MKFSKSKKSLRITRDIIGLVGYDVPLVVLTSWPDDLINQAEKWAVKSHLKASDNNVRVPKFPMFLEGFERKLEFK